MNKFYVKKIKQFLMKIIDTQSFLKYLFKIYWHSISTAELNKIVSRRADEERRISPRDTTFLRAARFDFFQNNHVVFTSL